MRKMTKKEREDKKKRTLQLYDLHRECVRRNPDYIKAYRVLETEADPDVREGKRNGLRFRWRLSPSDPLPHPDERPDLNLVKNGLSTPEWQILTPMTDVDSLEHAAATMLTHHLLDPNLTILDTIAPELKGFVFCLYFPEERDHTYPASWSLTTLDMRRTKKEIMQFCSAWFEGKLAQRKEHHLKQSQPRMRLRVEEEFDYLRAYDLKYVGKKFREIAEVLWPSKDATEQTRLAKTYCDKGNSLVHAPPLLNLAQEHKKARLRTS